MVDREVLKKNPSAGEEGEILKDVDFYKTELKNIKLEYIYRLYLG